MVSFVRLEAMQYINVMFRDKNKQDEKDKLKTKKRKNLSCKLHLNMDHCRTLPSNSQLDQSVQIDQARTLI